MREWCKARTEVLEDLEGRGIEDDAEMKGIFDENGGGKMMKDNGTNGSNLAVVMVNANENIMEIVREEGRDVGFLVFEIGMLE